MFIARSAARYRMKRPDPWNTPLTASGAHEDAMFGEIAKRARGEAEQIGERGSGGGIVHNGQFFQYRLM